MSGCFLFAAAAFCQPSERCGVVPRPVSTSSADRSEPPAQNFSEDLSFRSAVVTIPVVVHVVWHSAAENISDEQIHSQIAVLNMDFRKMNAEASGIPTVFQGIAADVEFEFCLATQDPDGKSTTGITRSYTQNSVGIGGTAAIHYEDQGGADAWNSAHYLNIWVAKFAGGVGGVGSFPGQDPPAEDGIEIDYRQFGTLLVEPPYHLGRTTTHEIGHYFNLEHPWGPSISDCCEDDFVSDTPPACETYLSQCPTHPVTSCSSADQFMNFLFYTDDACMAMFTQGQKLRMWAALNEFRAGLLNSQGCQPVAVEDSPSGVGGGGDLVIYQNPASSILQFEIKNRGQEKWLARLFDAVGREVFRQEVSAGMPVFVDVSSFAAGIFWLQIEREGRRFGKAVVKS